MIEDDPNKKNNKENSTAKSQRLKKRNIERGEETEESILNAISQSEPEGLRTKDLSDLLNLHGETIRIVSKKLMRENKIIKTGKYGYYHITKTFAKMDSNLQGGLFKKPAITRLFENSYYRLPSDNELRKIPDHYEFNEKKTHKHNIKKDITHNQSFNEEEIKEYKKLFEFDKDFSKENNIFNKILELCYPSSSDIPLTLSGKLDEKRKELLLNFVQKTGLLVTFIMIEAIKPIHEKIEDDEKKRKLSRDWIRNAIDIVEIWKVFRDNIINTVGKTVDLDNDDNNKLEKKHDVINNEYFYLEKDELTKQYLADTFQEMWPFTFKTLQNVRKDSIIQIQEFYDKTLQEFDNYDKNLRERLDQLKKNIKRRKANKQDK